MKIKLSILIVSIVLQIVCIGCGKRESAPEAKELVLLCGNSFIGPANQLCEEFKAQTGIEVVTTSAGSEDFLPLIKAASKGDILISHDPYLDYVKDAEAYFDHAQVGFVAPVLVVQKQNPKQLKSIDDLTTAGLRVALSNPQYSTCGEMVFELLERKGIKEAVLANVENRLTKGHHVLGTYLKTDAIDAAIMWNGVANVFSDAVEIVPTPYEYQADIRVHVIGLSYTKNPELLKQFIDFAKANGQTIFTQHGYVK
ncbi:MAG: substrate-binding domain-containing protein [Anaerohalosphaera sp.]|nr:substrate-binding domain-containing protein [Anaerohalosphaera sp.]